MCNAVPWVTLSDETRTRLIESLFRSEAIKTENPATVQCDAFQIEIFSREDALLSLPETSMLVAVASMTCQCVFSQFFLV